MLRLVGMLRTDGGELLAPQPKLADLPALAVQVRSAGLAVDLDIEGEQREIPAGIELAAYRIIQEAPDQCCQTRWRCHRHGPRLLPSRCLATGDH
jgi:hypothetical protein